MKDQSFWLKYTVIFIFSVLCFSLGAAWTSAHFYAEKTNEEALQELKNQSKSYQSEVSRDLRFLISDLISIQTQNITPKSSFSLLMTIDQESQKIVDIRPKMYAEAMDQFTNIPFKQLKDFPVAFYPLKLAWKKQNSVALLVDVDQIKTSSLPEHLAKGKILLGVLTSQGLLRLSRFLRQKGLIEAFILDRKKNWFYLHNNIQYSGRVVSSRYDFLSLREKHPQGWTLFLPSKNLLSLGVKMGVSDSYLVINKKASVWNQHFMGFFQNIFYILLAVGILLLIPTYLFIHPLLEAYRYLAQLFNRYASCHSFPVPEYRGYNGYINEIQPYLKQLFWRLREEKLFKPKEYAGESSSFSEMLKVLAERVSYKYPGIQVNIQSDVDAVLPLQSNWLEQALMEVIKNSAESMNGKGVIDIRSFEEQSMFCCQIRDHGAGMSPESIAQACDAYFTSKKGSSGLGLTLAQSALSRMGGVLHLCNAEDGQGLIAKIALPPDILKMNWKGRGKQTSYRQSFSVTELK